MQCPTYTLPCSISLEAAGYEDPRLSCCGKSKPQPKAAVPPSFGWVDEHNNPLVLQRITIANALTFGSACQPLLSKYPPAIFPVPAAAATDTPAVHHLVHTVNQILVRLRSCGILADTLQTQSKAQFYSRQVAGGSCDEPTVTKTGLSTIVGDAAVTALLAQWEALGLPEAIDEHTFTRFYVQMYATL